MWERDMIMDDISLPSLPLEKNVFPPLEAHLRTQTHPTIPSVPYNYLTGNKIPRKRKFHHETIDENQMDLEKNFMMYGMDTLVFDIEVVCPPLPYSAPVIPIVLVNKVKDNCSKQGNIPKQKVLKEENFTVSDWSSMFSLEGQLLNLAGTSKSCLKYKEIVDKLCFKLATSISVTSNGHYFIERFYQKDNLVHLIDTMIATVCIPVTSIKVEQDEQVEEGHHPVIKEEKGIRPSQIEDPLSNYSPAVPSPQQSIGVNQPSTLNQLPLHCSSLDSMCTEGSEKTFQPQSSHESLKSSLEEHEILSFEDTWVDYFEAV
jgi:hypothetical protein